MKTSQTMCSAALAVMVAASPLLPDSTVWQGPEVRSSVQQTRIRHALPFSLDHVLSYFSEAFNKGPNKTEEDTFEFVVDLPPGESASISVSSIDQHIRVVLRATGDTGVSYLKEFFEAPFFQPKETERLFILLEEGPGTHAANTDRFRMEVGLVETGRWIVISLDFSPLD